MRAQRRLRLTLEWLILYFQLRPWRLLTMREAFQHGKECYRRRLHYPLALFFHSLGFTLLLLAFLPRHPMTWPTAVGAGVSFAMFATVPVLKKLMRKA